MTVQVRRRAAASLAMALAFGACMQKPAPTVVAMEPRPNPPLVVRPPANPRDRLRQNRWLALFWEELTLPQRRRVETQLRRAKPPVVSGGASAAVVWDGLGLDERDRLVFSGIAPERPADDALPAGAEPETPPPKP